MPDLKGQRESSLGRWQGQGVGEATRELLEIEVALEGLLSSKLRVELLVSLALMEINQTFMFYYQPISKI